MKQTKINIYLERASELLSLKKLTLKQKEEIKKLGRYIDRWFWKSLTISERKKYREMDKKNKETKLRLETKGIKV